jgi:hypothetical protein
VRAWLGEGISCFYGRNVRLFNGYYFSLRHFLALPICRCLTFTW